MMVFLATSCMLAGGMLSGQARLRARATSRVQYSLADMLSLFVYCALPLAVYRSIAAKASQPDAGAWVACVVCSAICAMVWWYDIRSLRRMGVRRGRDRAIVLLVVVPLCVAAAGATPVLFFSVVGFLGPAEVSRHWWERVVGAVIASLSLGIAVATLYGCARYVRSLASRDGEPQSPSVKRPDFGQIEDHSIGDCPADLVIEEPPPQTDRQPRAALIEAQPQAGEGTPDGANSLPPPSRQPLLGDGG
jgi:hypothetical protein